MPSIEPSVRAFLLRMNDTLVCANSPAKCASVKAAAHHEKVAETAVFETGWVTLVEEASAVQRGDYADQLRAKLKYTQVEETLRRVQAERDALYNETKPALLPHLSSRAPSESAGRRRRTPTTPPSS